MKIVRKWIHKRRNSFPLRRKKKKKLLIELDKKVEIDFEPKISSNLQILNNQTKIMTEQEQLADSIESFPNNHPHGNCVCLFIMLVFYYLSIISTKLKNTLEESINNRKN